MYLANYKGDTELTKLGAVCSSTGEVDLSRINIFSSESSYNSNKGSVGSNELSLYPISAVPEVDYASSISVGSLSGYTAPAAGVIRGYAYGGDETVLYIHVNGVYAVYTQQGTTGWGYQRHAFLFLVDTGDYVTTGGAGGVGDVTFVPFKSGTNVKGFNTKATTGEVNLSKVNIFSSEASYTSNKENIGDNEISLYPADTVPKINYASRISIGTLNGYVTPAAGVITFDVRGGSSAVTTMHVNGTRAVYCRQCDSGYGEFCQPVTCLVPAGASITASGSVLTPGFIPYK